MGSTRSLNKNWDRRRRRRSIILNSFHLCLSMYADRAVLLWRIVLYKGCCMAGPSTFPCSSTVAKCILFQNFLVIYIQPRFYCRLCVFWDMNIVKLCMLHFMPTKITEIYSIAWFPERQNDESKSYFTYRIWTKTILAGTSAHFFLWSFLLERFRCNEDSKRTLAVKWNWSIRTF